MNSKDLTNILISENQTIFEAMQLININCKGILIVVDKQNRILGTITDGDIRRAILVNASLKSPVSNIYNKNSVFINNNYSTDKIKKIFIEKKIKFIPVVDNEKKIVSYYEIDDFIDYNKMEKENYVLIMAGGLGTRLRPLTDELPKPMLKVGNKPILQTIIEQFRDYGFKNIIISLNYKGEIIENYFRDGSDFGVSISYIKESKRLGTAGAVKLAKKYLDKPFFVINGDILTNVNFFNLMQHHIENKYCMTIGSRIYEMQIPYGVLNVDESCVTSLEEKPVYNYVVSGGVYVLNPENIAYIPENEYYDITQLINKLMEHNGALGYFPISEYWIDIGKIEDYYKANDDIREYF